MYGKRMREWYATVYIMIGYSGLPPTLPQTLKNVIKKFDFSDTH